MNENKKQENPQAIEDEVLDKVTGGASFEKYKHYEITCRDCKHKWEIVGNKPKQCTNCGRTNLDIYCFFEP